MSRRVLVALDSSPGSRAALARAVELARRIEAELTGVFVEDENLHRLAQLPFAAELLGGGQGRRSLSPASMEYEMQRQARALETELKQAAGARAVPWRFRVERGQVARSLLAACAGEELVVLGMAGQVPGPVRLGSTARQMLEQAGASLLLVAPRATGKPRPGLLAVFDGSGSGAAVLERARELAGPDGALSVLLVGGSSEQLEALRRQASALLPDVSAVFHGLTAVEGDGLARRVRELAPSTLVVGELPQLGRRGLEALLERLDGAVLRVRSP